MKLHPPTPARRTGQGDEQGTTLVYLALVLLVLIGFAGLALDGSHAYLERRHMQTAADAAALAGARDLALGKDPDDIINEYVMLNAVDAQHTWWPINNNTGVHVETQTGVDTWFATALGIDTIPVSAESEAGFLPVWGVGNLLPMSICTSDVNVGGGSTTFMWDNNMQAPGNFGWLSWVGDQDLPYLQDNIRNPSNSGVWLIGDDIPGFTGDACHPTEDELALWVGKAVVIPLYGYGAPDECTPPGTGSNNTYNIAAFAEFILDGYACNFCEGEPGAKCVWGHFTRNVAPSELFGEYEVDYGLRDLRLLK